MFEFIGEVFPMLVLFMLLRGILTTLFGGKRRRQEPDEDQYDYDENGQAGQRDQYGQYDYDQQEQDARYEAQQSAEEAEAKRKADYVRSFEEKLKGSGKGNGEKEREILVYTEDSSTSNGSGNAYGTVERGGIHRENCSLPHEKQPVYREPEEEVVDANVRRWQEYSAKAAKAGDVAKAAKSAAAKHDQGQVKAVPQRKPLFKGSSLQRAVIMSEVLGKPKGLQ